ncbi:alanine/glycine:cation symporter family protein [Novosphingopyxis iocasae]|uniref:alanine/glycine:cation symporter family protein n=1 Tax=Novosphingopyxis iocasae TaxID=2762729 RepID=UPI001650FE56|nr:amino acid carrier protein [Novosphingopyxis iocasae]
MIQYLNQGINGLSDIVFTQVSLFGISIEIVVLWLAVPMLFFTAYLGFVNLRHLGTGFAIIRGRLGAPDEPGQISQFSALTTALSATVGLGNIAGVAIALTVGGPGAVFWMFCIGWFAMTLKCAEVTLGLIYREVDANGEVRGGPMYSMKNGLKGRGWGKTGLIMGGVYAVCALMGAIPLIQVNQSFVAVADVFGFAQTDGNAWIYGIIMAAMVGLVVAGGVGWLSRVTSLVVPAMGGVYLLGVFAILIMGYERIPEALALIVGDAFTGQAAAGGAIGAFVIGMRRAVYSSEAGIGSAVMAHAQARTKEPASEGLVALIEPFIDTVVICSLGALAMVVAGTYTQDLEGIQVTVAAFATVAPWLVYLLAVAVFLFGYSTLCSWGFYGQQAWGYLFGHSAAARRIYKFIYIAALPVGAVLDLGQVVKLIDSAFILMALPNILALYLFAPEIRREVKGYLARRKGQHHEDAHARTAEQPA